MSETLFVFVCGTYEDLAEERAGVLDAIQKVQLQHDSMEFFGARPNQPIETCLAEVRRCDVLVVVVSHLYGSIVPEMDVSYTVAEYSEGYRLRKPCLIYIRDENVPVLPKYIEDDSDKRILLREFKAILRKRHTVATFRDSTDLSVAVAADLSRVKQELIAATVESLEHHLSILKHGVDVWNSWRLKNPEIKPNLDGADLYRMNLSSVDFSHAELTNANLSETVLIRANFSNANLRGTNLARALLGETIFVNANLSEARNLETTIHQGPSSVGIDTIYKSRGEIPEKFLRGCGVPENFITYMGSLTAQGLEFQTGSLTRNVLEFYSCFISYSRDDEEFAARIYDDLEREGVRCWFAPGDLKIGDRFRVRIDESIRLYDNLLLVLSKTSIASPWIEDEIEAALEREREQNKTVLFPVRLDGAVMEVKGGWPAAVRRNRHIGDFSEWKNHDSYRKAFERLMRDLKAEARRER